MTKLDPLTDSRFLNLIIPIVLLAGITLALHFLLGGRGWKDHTKGLWPLVVGKDRRLSTSKVQLVLWTFAIVLALLLLLFYGKNFSAFELEPEYLLLLGSPAAAALLAKTFTTTKISNGAVENSVAEEPSLKDVVSDDEGNTDLFDFQYFLFNLVLLLWFAVEMFRTLHDPSRLADEAYFLPPLPLSLVGLTSASAASYVVKKGLESERPVLQAAYPSAAALHEEVRLTGRYLRITSAAPEGGQPAQAPTAVTFGGRPASISSPLRANPQGFDEIGVVVPVDIPPGRADAQFTRADGAVSDPLQFEVTSGGPTVFSVSPDRVILKDNAQEVTIAGSGFGDPDPGAPPQTNRVTLGGVPLAVPNGYWNSERIRAQVPALAQARQQGLTVPGKHDLIVIDRYGRRSSPAEVELVEGANSDTSERTEIDLAAEEVQKSASEVHGHLAEYRRQIEVARGEGRRILEEARKEAEAQRERTKREAREEGDRIIHRAREEIDRERDAALREVRKARDGRPPLRPPNGPPHVTEILLGDEALRNVDDPKEGLEKGALKVTEVAQALFACITLLIALCFPIGIIVLWLQFKGNYTYNFNRSLYAASVTSKIVVIGKIVDVLILSTLILLLLISLWVVANFIYVWISRDVSDAAVKGYSVILSVPVVFLVFAVCVVVIRTDLFSDLGGPHLVDLLWHLLGIVCFVVVGTVIAGIFFWRARTDVSKNRLNRYGAFAALYLASTAAAVFWTGLGDLSLPAVALSLKEQGSTVGLAERETAARSMSDPQEHEVPINLIANPEESPQRFVLLSNFGSYWYVLDSCKHLLAIPNDLVIQATPITEDIIDIKNKDQCSNHSPAVVGDGANDALGTEGDLLKSSGAFSDPDASAPLKLSVPSNTLGRFTDNRDSTWSWELNTKDDVRKASIMVTATDDHGGTGTDSFVYRADNVAPTATFNHPDVDEGSDISLSLRDASDLGGEDTFTYAFDCGGSSYGAFRKSSSANCPTTDNGTRSVKGQIRDDDGGVTKYAGTTTITNVAPTATFKHPSAAINAGSGGFNLSLIEPSDPGNKDTFEYRFDCGSGTYGDWGASNSAHCSADGPATLVTKAQIRDDDGGVSEEYTKSVQVKKVSSPSICTW